MTDPTRPERARHGVAAVTRLRAAQPAPRRTDLEGTLALARPADPSAPSVPRPELRLVDGGQARTRAWTARFFQVLVEVLGGDRNPHQLLRSTSTEVYADLTRRCELMHRATGATQRARRTRARVRSVHVCQPSPLVAEVCARVEHGGRSRAIAGRLELVEGRWRCTALEIG